MTSEFFSYFDLTAFFEYFNQFFFGIYPYICIMMLIGVSIIRYDREQYTWKAGSSQLLRAKGMRMGNNLFHIGIILLFFGHLIGLLLPEAIYHYFITAGQKQLMAMIAGGIFGITCFIGLSILLHRRLFDKRVRATSRFSDIAILVMLGR